MAAPDLTSITPQVLLERWVFQYDPVVHGTPRSPDTANILQQIYKEMSILVRGVYSMLRILPARKVPPLPLPPPHTLRPTPCSTPHPLPV